MPRSIKQSLYGLFYLVVIGLVAYSVFGTAVPAAPAACIGDCPPSQSTVQIGAPMIFKTAASGYLEVLVPITNLSANYGAQTLYYNFSLMDAAGKTVATLPTVTDTLYPDETRDLLGVYFGDKTALDAVSSATLSIAPISWQPANAFPPPVLLVLAGPTTKIASSSVTVAGTVENNSDGSFAGGRAIVIVSDKYQAPLFAGSTVVPPLQPFATTTLTVALPADPAFVSRIYPPFTKLLLYQ